MFYFKLFDRIRWEVSERFPGNRQAPSRMQVLLASGGPINIVFSDAMGERGLSLALRVSYDFHVYHKLASTIMPEERALEILDTSQFPAGNVLYLGESFSPFAQTVLRRNQTPFSISDNLLTLDTHKLSDSTLATLFLHPHPKCTKSVMLFILANSVDAIERGLRLVPLRTGVPAPSWLVISQLADVYGLAGICGAGVWTCDWACSDALSMWMI